MNKLLISIIILMFVINCTENKKAPDEVREDKSACMFIEEAIKSAKEQKIDSLMVAGISEEYQACGYYVDYAINGNKDLYISRLEKNRLFDEVLYKAERIFGYFPQKCIKEVLARTEAKSKVAIGLMELTTWQLIIEKMQKGDLKSKEMFFEHFEHPAGGAFIEEYLDDAIYKIFQNEKNIAVFSESEIEAMLKTYKFETVTDREDIERMIEYYAKSTLPEKVKKTVLINLKENLKSF